MHHVTVKIGFPGSDMVEQWAVLSRNAGPNVFMHPAALLAAHASGIARIHLLLAWRGSEHNGKLIGVWAMQEVSLTPLWPSVLSAPPHRHAFLSNPVIDPDCIDEVLAAFFDAIGDDSKLPRVLRLRYLDAQVPTFAAIVKALEARGATALKLVERERAFVTRESGVKLTGSTRKKLRQDWRRLSALGEVEVRNDRECDAARNAFETYLVMEAASWKGSRGTAMLCNEAEAAFARQMIAALAQERNASVALLKVDGRVVAAQVLLYAGTTAYTWKTAFDPGFAKFSPGALLVDRITDQLFTAEGIESIDSCSPEGGFMTHSCAFRLRRILSADVCDVASRRNREAGAARRDYVLAAERCLG